MVFTLIAVPHIVFVKRLSLLKLLQAVSELNSCLLTIGVILLISIEVLNFDQEIEQSSVNILLPHHVHLNVLIARIRLIAEEVAVGIEFEIR